jgi:hypothetical protein
MSSVPISFATALASSAVLATEPLGTPTPYYIYHVVSTRIKASEGDAMQLDIVYLAQEVGREVLMNAQSSFLLGNAGESDSRGDPSLLNHG